MLMKGYNYGLCMVTVFLVKYLNRRDSSMDALLRKILVVEMSLNQVLDLILDGIRRQIVVHMLIIDVEES